MENKYRLSPYAHLANVHNREGFLFFEDTGEPIEKVGADEVLIKTVVVLWDGSDIHSHNKDKGMHPNAIDKDFIPLHEGAGLVVMVGSDVTEYKNGDYVAVESTIMPCKQCGRCRAKRPSQCDKLEIVGIGTKGLGATHAVLPEIVLVKVPDDIEPEIAAQLEPLGVSTHAMLRGQQIYEAITRNNSKKTIYLVNGGTGSIGRLTIASLIADGIPASNILATGASPNKIERLSQIFPEIKTANIKDADSIKKLKNKIEGELEQFGGKVPIVIEATGYDPSNILDFIGKDTVVVGVGLSSKSEDLGESKIDANNMVVRSQRVVWTKDKNLNSQELIEKAREVYRSTVSEDLEAEIQVINSANDIERAKRGKQRFDILVDNIGSSPLDLDRLSRKGAIWILSEPAKGNSPFPIKALLEKGAIIAGSWGRDWQDWEVMFDQIKKGKLNLAELEVKLYPFKKDTWKLPYQNAKAGKTGYDMRL